MGRLTLALAVALCSCTVRAAAAARAGEQAHRLSVTVSPYHLAYPMLFWSTELRIFRRLGLALDSGFGGYAGGLSGQLGLRAPFYATGSFDGGLQLGPFVRMTRLQLPDPDALDPSKGSSTRRAAGVVYNDVEFARANGRDAVYAGLLVGGKWIVGRRTAVRALQPVTVQGGLLLGYHQLVGETRYGPHPEASRTGDGFLPMLYVDAGISL